jgi:hypothetical protein
LSPVASTHGSGQVFASPWASPLGPSVLGPSKVGASLPRPSATADPSWSEPSGEAASVADRSPVAASVPVEPSVDASTALSEDASAAPSVDVSTDVSVDESEPCVSSLRSSIPRMVAHATNPEAHKAIAACCCGRTPRVTKPNATTVTARRLAKVRKERGPPRRRQHEGRIGSSLHDHREPGRPRTGHAGLMTVRGVAGREEALVLVGQAPDRRGKPRPPTTERLATWGDRLVIEGRRRSRRRSDRPCGASPFPSRTRARPR